MNSHRVTANELEALEHCGPYGVWLRRPSFIRAVEDPTPTNLRLPPAWIKKFPSPVPNKWYLVGPDGRVWPLQTGKNQHDEILMMGWNGIVRMYNMHGGEQVLFTPVSHNTIELKVFGREFCERTYRLAKVADSDDDLLTDTSEDDDDEEDDDEEGDDGEEQQLKFKEDMKGKGKAKMVEEISSDNDGQQDEPPIRGRTGPILSSRVNKPTGRRDGTKKMDVVFDPRTGKPVSFLVEVRKSHIKKYQMNIPAAFVRILPDANTTPVQLLPGDQRKLFDCLYIRSGGNARLHCAGWKNVVENYPLWKGLRLRFDLLDNDQKCIKFLLSKV